MNIKLKNLTFPTKLTVAGLIACAVAIWIQWLSGDPAYPKFPPGPVFFMVVAAMVAFGARWWWTPLIGSLIGLLVTSGWLATLTRNVERLAHPGRVGHFAAGIFLGALMQIVALVLTDVAGLVATVQNYRSRQHEIEVPRMVLRFFGTIFVVMGVVVMASRLHADPYHNLMHMIWGALALGASFMALRAARMFCIGSGLFYLTLALLGLMMGDQAMGRSWQAGPMLLHTGDHVFHLVLGCIFLIFGLFPERSYREEPARLPAR